MLPQEVKSGDVHRDTGLAPLAAAVSQMRTSPSRFAAASRLPSGLNAQLKTGGVWL